MNFTGSERRVLDIVCRKGPISRSEIAAQLDLTTGPVTRITQRLLNAGMLIESVHHAGARGTPARPLNACERGALAFGVSFSHRHLDIGLIDLRGNLLGSIRSEFEDARPQLLAAAVREGVSTLINRYPADRDRILGVGFAVPGDFTSRRSINAHPYFPHLRDVDLVTVLSQATSYPIYIENDCNAAALGERLLGSGRQFKNFVAVFVCHGIGGGIVLDAALYRGAHGNAGGLHSFFPLSHSRPSGHDLFDMLAREGHGLRDFHELDHADVLDLSGVRPWLARAGAQLAAALTIAARLFDPEAIIIGGRLPLRLLDELTDQIDKAGFCLDAPLAKPDLLPSALGPRAGVIGAGAVVFHEALLARSGN